MNHIKSISYNNWQYLAAIQIDHLRCSVCGGSNGNRVRLWRWELQKLADELGLAVQVCHLPPGTSKRNKIERRMFCHISANWRGRPLVSRQVVVNLIGRATAKNALHIKAALDEKAYASGIKATDEELASSRLSVMSFTANGTIDCVRGARKFRPYCSSYFCLTPKATGGGDAGTARVAAAAQTVHPYAHGQGAAMATQIYGKHPAVAENAPALFSSTAWLFDGWPATQNRAVFHGKTDLPANRMGLHAPRPRRVFAGHRQNLGRDRGGFALALQKPHPGAGNPADSVCGAPRADGVCGAGPRKPGRCRRCAQKARMRNAVLAAGLATGSRFCVLLWFKGNKLVPSSGSIPACAGGPSASWNGCPDGSRSPIHRQSGRGAERSSAVGQLSLRAS